MGICCRYTLHYRRVDFCVGDNRMVLPYSGSYHWAAESNRYEFYHIEIYICCAHPCGPKTDDSLRVTGV